MRRNIRFFDAFDYANFSRFVIVLVIFVLHIHVRPARADTIVSVPPYNPPPVTIGAILPLSGDIAAWGRNVQRGIDLAIAKSPHIRVIYEDETFCNSSKALSAFHELVSRHRVKIVITGCLNGTRVITPVAKRLNVLVLSAGLLSGEESGSDAQQLISFSGQIAAEGAEIAKLVTADKRNLTAFIRYEDEFTSAVLRSIERGLVATGSTSKVLDLPVPSDFMDFSALITRAKNKGADSLLTYVGERQLLAVIKRRDELNFKVPSYSGYIVESNAFPKSERERLEGFVYAYPKLADDSDEKRLQFEKAYSDSFGNAESPNSNSYFTYDGLQVLQVAFNYCKGDDPACIRKYFLEKGPFHGASGEFSFTSEGFVNREFVVKTVRDGEFVEQIQSKD